MEGIMKCENNLCFGLDDTLSFLLKKLNNPAGLNKEFNEIPKKRVSAGTIYLKLTFKRTILICPNNSALNIQNISKNRSNYILPYEDTRVSIQPTTHNINGYINASHIKIPLGGNNVLEYLITQNPLQNTINDFYQMVWEKNIHVIAMIQKQSNASTIPTYWPSNINEKLKLASFSVRLRSSNKSTSVLALKCLRSGRKRTIYHIKFTDVDDCCTPISSDSFLGFVDTVGKVIDIGGGDIVGGSTAEVEVAE
uniref:Tyrosine-protein phosphatase domain-containing protein n=1 Tax=Rhabditophanes sp. KR3021 TaxID=114890 RepID=A0AC35UCD1_9BILA